METILAHPENKEQAEVIKAFFKALKIKFESKKEAQAKVQMSELGKKKDAEEISEAIYTLTEEQQQRLEQSRASISAGNFKTNDQIKSEVAAWLHSL